MRLIDADALEKAIYKWMPKDQSTWMDSDLPPIENLVVSIMMTIQEQPAIDAVPVRHGRWIEEVMDDGHGFPRAEYTCPFCQYKTQADTNYCPECGARLSEE